MSGSGGGEAIGLTSDVCAANIGFVMPIDLGKALAAEQARLGEERAAALRRASLREKAYDELVQRLKEFSAHIPCNIHFLPVATTRGVRSSLSLSFESKRTPYEVFSSASPLAVSGLKKVDSFGLTKSACDLTDFYALPFRQATPLPSSPIAIKKGRIGTVRKK